MLIQKQYNKLTLLEIWLELEIQQCFSLSKKQKKKEKKIFHKELGEYCHYARNLKFGT